MKISKLKEVLENASEDVEIKIDNGEIVIIEPKPIEYKFKVGDKVIFPLFSKDKAMTITEQLTVNGCPCYNLKSYNNIYIRGEEDEILPYIPQDITERIKTFNHACLWCYKNGKKSLVDDFNDWQYVDKDVADIIAYLKLRIITAALNEGWEPTAGKEDARYYPYFTDSDDFGVKLGTAVTNFPRKLCFKSTKFAEYAATQFKDIYADFFGYGKGGEG